MTFLIAGLVLFLGTHSIRIFADDWRSARIAAAGERTWKIIFSLASIAGFILIVHGYGQARATAQVLYTPPDWSRPVAAVLMLLAFILVAAVYVRGTRIKARIGHPLVAGAKTWAIAHLVSNGSSADVVLFGAILAWAVLDFRASRRRDRAAGVKYAEGPVSRDVAAIVIGIAAWAIFALLHGPLIGVRPFA